jgi:uncharacterized protein (DUF1015 family)
MIVQPFPGLRPRKDLSSRIPSYPYDVVDADEARKLTSGDPYSFLHVVRSEVDLPPEIDPHDERVYAKARENLQSMVEKGWLERDPGDAYYVYRLTRGEHVQSGLVGVAAVEGGRDEPARSCPDRPVQRQTSPATAASSRTLRVIIPSPVNPWRVS